MGKSYIVPAAQVDTLRRRKCWEKERKIYGSGEKRLLYKAGMVVESMVEVSHEDVTYIQCTKARCSFKWEKPCMTVLSLSQSRVNDREVKLGWCTHRTLSPFRIRTPEYWDNQQLLVDRKWTIISALFCARILIRTTDRGHWRFLSKRYSLLQIRVDRESYSRRASYECFKCIKCWKIVSRCFECETLHREPCCLNDI